MTDQIEGFVGGMADANIESILIDYDDVVINLGDLPYWRTVLRCSGYIGYSVIGFWDDLLVQGGQMLDTSPLQEACIADLARRYRTPRPPDSGSPVRNLGAYRTLSIDLTDGATINIVAAQFSVEYLSTSLQSTQT
jgi:hypothetical protein